MAKIERHLSLDFCLPEPRIWRPQTRVSQGWRGAYFAALADHGIRLKDARVRHAYNGVIVGKDHAIKSTNEWTGAQKHAWMERFSLHCASGCPGGERCEALRKALTIAAREGVPA